MLKMAKIFRILHYIEDLTLVLAVLGILCLAVGQIVMRNFFDTGFPWSESFARVLVLWIAMLGALIAARRNDHINIDAINRFLPVRGRQTIFVLTNFASAGICLIVAYYGVEFVSYEFEDNTIAFANVPTWVCQVILPIGFFLMGTRFFLHGMRGCIG